MSATIAQARVKRLVNQGLVETNCTPAERISQLRSRIEGAERAFGRMEAVFSALGDTTRLKMLKAVGEEELCSCEVMAALELTQPTTSHHLGILERAGLLRSRREGKWVFYRSTKSTKNLISKGSDLVRDTNFS